MFQQLVKYLLPKIQNIYISINNNKQFKISTQQRITRITIEDPGIVTVDNIWE